MPRYFCCRLVPSGIGDQVSQLARLYNIGRSFGLEYLFQELPANRWSPDFDAWDFLGLGLGERRVKDFPDHEIVSVDGAAASHALVNGRALASLLPPRMPDRSIVEFVHSDQMYSSAIPVPMRHAIDLRAKLLQRHGDRITAGHSDRLSICVHIRQGDCTWVKSGDKYVFLGTRKIVADSDEVDLRRAPMVEAYFPLLDALVVRLQGVPHRVTVYSDGPTNIFPLEPSRVGGILYHLARRDGRLIDSLRLNRRGNPLQALYNPMCDAEVRREYEHVKTGLQRLAARYDATLVVGTGKDLTAAAILAFAAADVAVLARNPGVFPLLGLGDPDRQAVLVLTRSIADNMKSIEDLMLRRS
ncbi:MAG: hypothetical protein ABI868_06290 [Acidobacteriota bacterium]